MRELAAPPVFRFSLAPSLLTGLAALADIVLLQAWIGGEMLMIVVLALHLCLSAAFGAMFYLSSDRSVSRALANVTILALFGPFGGVALVVIGPAVAIGATQRLPVAQASSPVSSPRDAAEILYDQICQRRRHRLAPKVVPSFLQTFQGAPLHQQQEAIAAISRGYHPDMRPALAAALASAVPALRVQAAAVYAKLRGRYGERAKEILAKGRSGFPETEIREVADSGFVDDETRNALLDLAAQIEPDTSPPLAMTLAPSRVLAPMPRLKRYSCGGLA